MAAVGFSLVALLTGWYIALASRFAWFDLPNHRSSHSKPTPGAGGIPMVVVFLLLMAFQFISGHLSLAVFVVMALGGVPLVIVSAWDDFKPVSAGVRFMLQALACSVAVVTLLQGHWVVLQGVEIPLNGWVWPIAVFAALWMVNLFNFMDGIDGLAAIEGISLFAGLAVIHAVLSQDAGALSVLTTLVACVLGFICWNWAPARVFMGDVGSVFLGYVFVAVSLWGIGEGWWTVWTPIILSAAFWVDATVTLMCRVRRGQKVYEAHRSHAYQRLSRRWGSHGRVSALYGVVNGVWLFPIAFMVTAWPAYGLGLFALAVMPLILAVWKVGAGLPDAE